MSNNVNDTINDNLMELGTIVQFHREFWEGTLWDYELERAYNNALKSLDTTEIDEMLKDSAREMFEQEYAPEMPDYKLYNKQKGFNIGEMPF